MLLPPIRRKDIFSFWRGSCSAAGGQLHWRAHRLPVFRAWKGVCPPKYFLSNTKLLPKIASCPPKFLGNSIVSLQIIELPGTYGRAKARGSTTRPILSPPPQFSPPHFSF